MPAMGRAMLALGAVVAVALAALTVRAQAASTVDGRVDEILVRLRVTSARTADACAPGGVACAPAAASAMDAARRMGGDLRAVHVPQDLRRAKRLVLAALDDFADAAGAVGACAPGPARQAAVSAMGHRRRAVEDRAAALVDVGVAFRK
jgi:hypothetical protein